MEKIDLNNVITQEKYKEAMKLLRKKYQEQHPELKEKSNAYKREWDRKKKEDPEYRKKMNERHLKYYHENPEYKQRQNERAKERYRKMKELAQKAESI